MSDKKRRDITLGEMQEECKRVKGLCVDGCKFIDVCPNRCDVETRPSKWDLSDPPRFNEAQMAFWRGWYAIGARHACHMIDIDRVYMFDGSGAFPKVQLLSTTVDTGLKKGETLDLAELFGKDGAEC